jgi:hypothetical protein
VSESASCSKQRDVRFIRNVLERVNKKQRETKRKERTRKYKHSKCERNKHSETEKHRHVQQVQFQRPLRTISHHAWQGRCLLGAGLNLRGPRDPEGFHQGVIGAPGIPWMPIVSSKGLPQGSLTADFHHSHMLKLYNGASPESLLQGIIVIKQAGPSYPFLGSIGDPNQANTMQKQGIPRRGIPRFP